MSKYTINVMKDFAVEPGKPPYGRYPGDSVYCGQNFRKLLVSKLDEYDYVHVNLDGYNRYGRSFLDEAFGGLIREEGIDYDYIKEHLTYSHSLVKSIEGLIADRIEAARISRRDKRPPNSGPSL